MLCKICGMRRQEDLDYAEKIGVDFCGFIFHPQSKRFVTPSEVATLQTRKMKRVGVFVEQDFEEIQSIMQEAKLDYAQLHGSQSIVCAEKIGAEKIIRVFWVSTYENKDALEVDLEKYARTSAYFLFDAGKSGGGSGLVIDWNMVHNLKSPKPWFLAGGLSPQNLEQALSGCKPYGIDCNSGVEIESAVKDHKAMLEVMKIKNNI